MASGFNSFTGIGNLTRDPELKHIGSGTAVCTPSTSVNMGMVSSDSPKPSVALVNAARNRIASVSQKSASIHIFGIALITYGGLQTM